jgi:hypothetical protein
VRHLLQYCPDLAVFWPASPIWTECDSWASAANCPYQLKLRALRKESWKEQEVLRSRLNGEKYRPKGEYKIAQAFRPGNPAQANRPERASECRAYSQRFGRPFRAISFCVRSPGLKAWAILFSPFGRRNRASFSRAKLLRRSPSLIRLCQCLESRNDVKQFFIDRRLPCLIENHAQPLEQLVDIPLRSLHCCQAAGVLAC